MRAAWYERTGPAHDVLAVGEMPAPDLEDGDVLVRVHASGVNPSDWKARAGSRPMAFPRVIPHSDGAGVIEAVGGGVDRRRIGERVWLWNAQWRRPFGTAAEHVALPAAQAVRLPDQVGFEAGACLGIPALTAYRAVTIDGPVAGQTVLVAGGAGAVGHYAIQFAKLLGARSIIATVSSPAKADCARAAGADHTVDYRSEPVAERIRDLTDGRGAERIVEVDIAANAVLLPQVVARDGLCVAYGSGRPDVTLPFFPMIMSGAAVRFFIVYELSPDARRAAIEALARWLEEDRVAHAIGATLPLERIADAHEAVRQGSVIGNVVLTI